MPIPASPVWPVKAERLYDMARRHRCVTEYLAAGWETHAEIFGATSRDPVCKSGTHAIKRSPIGARREALCPNCMEAPISGT